MLFLFSVVFGTLGVALGKVSTACPAWCVSDGLLNGQHLVRVGTHNIPQARHFLRRLDGAALRAIRSTECLGLNALLCCFFFVSPDDLGGAGVPEVDRRLKLWLCRTLNRARQTGD